MDKHAQDEVWGHRTWTATGISRSRGSRGEHGAGNHSRPGTRATWPEKSLLRTEVMNLPGPARCERYPDFSACQVFLLVAPPLASFWPRVLLSPFVFPIETSYLKPNFPSGHNVFQYSIIPKLGFQSRLKEPTHESSLGPPSFQMEQWAPSAGVSLPEPQKSSPPACTPGTAKSLLFQLGTRPCCLSCPFLSPTCSQGLLN